MALVRAPWANRTRPGTVHAGTGPAAADGAVAGVYPGWYRVAQGQYIARTQYMEVQGQYLMRFTLPQGQQFRQKGSKLVKTAHFSKKGEKHGKQLKTMKTRI